MTQVNNSRVVGVKPGDKVGVVGMGGLGHMGIKFAKAMGAEVTLFTRSESKVQEGKVHGATHCVISTDEKQMEQAAVSMDYILDTVPVDRATDEAAERVGRHVEASRSKRPKKTVREDGQRVSAPVAIRCTTSGTSSCSST